MTSPYTGLPNSAYWRTAVAGVNPHELQGMWLPRFNITRETKIATAGSCFAQHLRSPLISSGLAFVDSEPAPIDLPSSTAKAFGYATFSARYGNIYSTRQLLQLIRDASHGHISKEAIWEKNGRYFDGLRPNVEPYGLESPEEALLHRRHHLANVDKVFSKTDVVIFTLGLTENWVSSSGLVFPTAPGVVANPPSHCEIEFHNASVSEVTADLQSLMLELRKKNSQIKLLLTVSPIPLTATRSGNHILKASTASKAILRAAVEEFVNCNEGVDYFPSFEIITNPASKGVFLCENSRNVTTGGITASMKMFLASMNVEATDHEGRYGKGVEDGDVNLNCEEVLNDEFVSS
jgi:GSCFA family